MNKQMPDKLLPGIYSQGFFTKFMQPKILSKRTWLITFLLGFTLFVVLLFSFISKNTIQSISTLLAGDIVTQGDPVLLTKDAAAFSNQEQTSVGFPVRLKISEIDVDAAIISVGLTSDGAMDAPKNPDEVAWYSLGSRPGENGTAVIAGHYDWINNILAVFSHLHELRKGDKIFIEDEKGEIVTFVVREIRTYDKDEYAPDVFISDDDKAHLNLITCIGVWDEASKSYSKRLVVFTDKE